MKKTLFRFTATLIFIAAAAKLVSFAVRILLARHLSSEAMNYYTLAAPTMVFIITLAQMGIPAALSKVIAQSQDRRKPFIASIILSLVTNLLLSFLFILLIPWLSAVILKQSKLTSILYAIVPLIPLVALSGILKGYLLGIQEHVRANVCQLFEELSRLLFLYVYFLWLPQTDALHLAQAAMLSVSVGELCSCLYMLCSLWRKKKRLPAWKNVCKTLGKQPFHEILSISLPMTGSRLLGSLTCFLEPILMLVALQADTRAFMVNAYGQLNGYLMPIITMPSFLTVTLSNMLLPSFTYHYSRGHDKQAARLFSLIICCCLLFGAGCSFLCYMFPKQLLQLFYQSSQGADMLQKLAIPFALYSLQPPLSSMLHALSLSKKSMLDTLLGSLFRLVSIALLSPWLLADTLLVGLCGGMLVTTLAHAIRLYIALQKQERPAIAPYV